MLNKIMLIGNLGKDPEMQVTAEGTPFTRFSLAVNRSYTSSSGEKVEETESGTHSLEGNGLAQGLPHGNS
jgi:single stranded DNA-binding protein